ncbi:hypothetical protein [Marinobacter sp. W-8]|uniref:hypothetical protein n=1 Tax=Marinobacter sp. W-8 TaxID=3369658 RepID=UPI0037C8FA49
MKVHSKLEMGDLLYRSKGVVAHAGVYLGADRVLHIQPGARAATVPFQQYADGKMVAVKRQGVQRNGFSRRLLEISQSQATYSLTSNNCEHTAYYLTSGERVSPQLQAALGLGFLGGVLAAKGKMSNFLAGAGIAGIAALLVSNANRKYDFTLQP